VGGIELQLFRGEGAARGDDPDDTTAVQVGSIDVAVVGVRLAHPGPEDMTRLDIDRDAIRNTRSPGREHRDVGAVRARRHDAAAANVEEEETAPCRVGRDGHWRQRPGHHGGET
jgi:hypothetical protein